MSKIILSGAKLKCGEGLAPSSLTVIPKQIDGDDKPVATVQDYKPFVNIAAFGMCKTQANPQVAAATAAAQGVLTPQPCTPVITAPWSPGSSVVTVDGEKALTEDSTCNCQWTGKIEITDANSSKMELE